MPTYTFTNTKTKETWSEYMYLADYDKFLKNNPHIIQEICAPAIGDPYHLGRLKTPGGFRNILKRIKQKHRGSTIDSGNLGEV